MKSYSAKVDSYIYWIVSCSLFSEDGSLSEALLLVLVGSRVPQDTALNPGKLMTLKWVTGQHLPHFLFIFLCCDLIPFNVV